MDTIDWRRAVELAGRAPSVHNTQPWRFFVNGDTAQLWADRSRTLPAMDPTSRQLVVSCGAALEHLRLAVLAQGQRGDVELVDDPGTPDLLARLHVTGVATPDRLDAALISAIPTRTTVREPFDPKPIPDDAIAALRDDSTVPGTWTRPVIRRDEQIDLIVLLDHADTAEYADPSLQQEIQAWRRRADSKDGIPDAAVPTASGRHTNLTLRDFTSPASPTRAPVAAPLDEKPLVMIVGTSEDRQDDWLNAGRRTARLLLQATSLGIVASPLNQVLDDAAPRQQLRAALGLVGWPQMVLRMGYGHAEPLTGRRSVDEILTVVNR
jgi:Nitroreductase family